MMKKALLLLLVALTGTLTLSAQKETDFTSRFLEQDHVEESVFCQTVGPAMIAQLVTAYSGSLSPEVAAQLKNIKSMRVVTAKGTLAPDELLRIALNLLQQDKGRYTELAEKSHYQLYARKKKDTIVELILIDTQHAQFNMVNVTGTLDADALQQLISKTQ